MKKLVSLLLFLALLVGVVLYALGAFHGEQVAPGRAPFPEGDAPPQATVLADRVQVPVVEEAVGTVESRMQVVVSAQVQARVKAVHADAGQRVDAGAVLLELDDRELAARRGQAADGLRQAQAARERALQAKAKAEAVLQQAQRHFDRVQGLLAASAATPEQQENAEAGLLQAQAGLADAEAAIAAADAAIEQARQAVAAADVSLGHATIKAPITGVVAMKAVEPGDIAWPGKSLMEVLDPVDLRLEAQVREGLIGKVERAAEYRIEIPAAGQVLAGIVAEICPTADPLSRTFRVRVDIEPTAGIHPGMFGRLRIPVGTREAVVIPWDAVLRVGQLEVALVQHEGQWTRRYVTTGRGVGEGKVEILSGLAGGETVGLPGAP